MINLLLAQSFRKMIFIDQNLNRALVTYSFDELLIFFLLTLVYIFCWNLIFNFIRKNMLQRKQTMK